MADPHSTPTPETDALITGHKGTASLGELAGHYNALLDHARKLERERDEARAALRWIPVSERLPSEEADKTHPGDTISKWLVVFSPGCIPEIARLHWPTNSWETPDKMWPQLPITHWLPLPAAPQDEGGGK